MSNRESLRKLSSKLPGPKDIELILDGLHLFDDITLAVTGSAIVEAHLERLIQSRFLSRSASLTGQIFKNRGPLMDFHSKILIAEAFGIVSKQMAEELHSLKAVRNAFAHSKVPLTFTDKFIRTELESMALTRALVQNDEPGKEVEWQPRQWFEGTVRILLVIIYQISVSDRTVDEILSKTLRQLKPSQEK